jgi:hypothetical protein
MPSNLLHFFNKVQKIQVYFAHQRPKAPKKILKNQDFATSTTILLCNYITKIVLNLQNSQYFFVKFVKISKQKTPLK